MYVWWCILLLSQNSIKQTFVVFQQKDECMTLLSFWTLICIVNIDVWWRWTKSARFKPLPAMERILVMKWIWTNIVCEQLLSIDCYSAQKISSAFDCIFKCKTPVTGIISGMTTSSWLIVINLSRHFFSDFGRSAVSDQDWMIWS